MFFIFYLAGKFNLIIFIVRISQIDNQVGLVQQILCDKEEKMHQNSCHLLEGTICHLLQHCGDGHNGARFAGCHYEFDWRVIAPTLTSLRGSNCWLFLPLLFCVVVMVALAVVPELV